MRPLSLALTFHLSPLTLQRLALCQDELVDDVHQGVTSQLTPHPRLHAPSYGMFIRRLLDPTIEAIERKISMATRLPISHQEDMQVLRYTKGQKYGGAKQEAKREVVTNGGVDGEGHDQALWLF